MKRYNNWFSFVVLYGLSAGMVYAAPVQSLEQQEKHMRRLVGLNDMRFPKERQYRWTPELQDENIKQRFMMLKKTLRHELRLKQRSASSIQAVFGFGKQASTNRDVQVIKIIIQLPSFYENAILTEVDKYIADAQTGEIILHSHKGPSNMEMITLSGAKRPAFLLTHSTTDIAPEGTIAIECSNGSHLTIYPNGDVKYVGKLGDKNSEFKLPTQSIQSIEYEKGIVIIQEGSGSSVAFTADGNMSSIDVDTSNSVDAIAKDLTMMHF